MSNLKIEEDADCSCRALSYFAHEMTFTSETMEGKELILRDLYRRAASLDTLERALILAETFDSVVPARIRADFGENYLKISEFCILRRKGKQKRDIGFVTVIGTELQAVLSALGRAKDARPDRISGDFSYWFANIQTDKATPLTVVVTVVAEARNIPCAIAVEHLLSDYDLELLVLVGIAAGPKSKVKLGDVIYAEQVIDYEECRLELSKWFRIPRALPRPKVMSPEKGIKVSLERLDKAKCHTLFTRVLEQTEAGLLPPNRVKGSPFAIRDGTIAAGEKLIADGSLERMRLRIDERIRAGAMEDSGFAQVANIKKVTWCIFRGISDFGDPRKASGWQYIAALGAACTAVVFLQTVWISSCDRNE